MCMVNNMKRIIGTVLIICVGIAACVSLAVYIGYSIINEKILKEDSLDLTANYYDDKTNTYKKNTNIKMSNNKLMVVAHPDDETIFGGAHLIEGDYTVVCVTCGVVDYRLAEFKKAMSYSSDKYMYLSHTDLEPDAHISDWTVEKNTINNELKNIIESQDWDLIVVHNPDGEYGHKHHKMLSEMVTNNVENKDILYYFGKFQEKETVDNTPTVKESTFKRKKAMLALYKSQPSCTDKGKLTYAFDHENWIKYKDWQ